MSQGFHENHIKVLTNESATRKKILDALQNLLSDTHPGDFIFLYFSGHGTSSYDPETQMLNLEPHTGALVPADFRMDGSTEDMVNRLIIGKRDIRPILEKLEIDRTVFAVADACYSGETFRRFKPVSVGKPKFLNLPAADAPPTAWRTHTRQRPPFPYRNTVYLAAASDTEQAMDIPAACIPSIIQTYDGKPHGAMTNALLHALNGKGDSNADGNITFGELIQFVRSTVAERFPHTPRLQLDKVIQERDPVRQELDNDKRNNSELKRKIQSIQEKLDRVRQSGNRNLRVIQKLDNSEKRLDG